MILHARSYTNCLLVGLVLGNLIRIASILCSDSHRCTRTILRLESILGLGQGLYGAGCSEGSCRPEVYNCCAVDYDDAAVVVLTRESVSGCSWGYESGFYSS